MFVFMQNGNKIPTNEPARIGVSDDPDSRFWYWRGASGQRYIHSVYDLSSCPPLPGAVYVAARSSEGGCREAVACGVLPRAPGAAMRAVFAKLAEAGAEELHVHLLASSPADALAIRDDLRALLGVSGAGELRPGGRHRGPRGMSDPAVMLAAFAPSW